MDKHSADCTCGSRRSQAETLQLLEEHHQFPGPYMFKVIGYQGGGFYQAVRQVAEAVLGPLSEGRQVRSRPSSGDKYLAVTLDVEVESASQVLEVYAELKRLEGVVVLV